MLPVTRFIASSYTGGADFVRATVSQLPYRSGTTSTDAALRQARNDIFGQIGDRATVSNVVIIITDGVPFPGTLRQPTIEAAIDLQRVATVFAVGITDNIDMDLLSRLSSLPRVLNRNFFSTPDFVGLEEKFLPLLESVCVTPTPPPCKAIFYFLHSKLQRKRYNVTKNLIKIYIVVMYVEGTPIDSVKCNFFRVPLQRTATKP